MEEKKKVPPYRATNKRKRLMGEQKLVFVTDLTDSGFFRKK